MSVPYVIIFLFTFSFTGENGMQMGKKSKPDEYKLFLKKTYEVKKQLQTSSNFTPIFRVILDQKNLPSNEVFIRTK